MPWIWGWREPRSSSGASGKVSSTVLVSWRQMTSGACSSIRRSSSGRRSRTELMFQVARRKAGSILRKVQPREFKWWASNDDHGQGADAVDLAVQPVAAPDRPDPFRRAREDQVAGLEGDQPREA